MKMAVCKAWRDRILGLGADVESQELPIHIMLAFVLCE